MADVFIRRYSHIPICEVVVAIRGRELLIKCKTYDAAVK